MDAGLPKIDIANYIERPVGKNFKNSKVEYIYEFFVNGVQQVVKLVRSYSSGKIRILINEELVHQEDK